MADLLFPSGFHFDCGSCTKCCRGWNVHVDAASYARLAGSALTQRLAEEHGEHPLVGTGSECRTRLHHGSCVFLDGKLCTIHRDIAAEAKPLGCREFPFVLVETPEGACVGLSFYCSAVQHDSGRPLEAHADELRGLLGQREFTRVGFDPIVFDQQSGITWQAYLAIEKFFEQALSGAPPRLSLWRSMMGLFMAALTMRRQVAQMHLPPEAYVLLRDDRLAVALADGAAAVAALEHDELFQYLDRMFMTGVIGVVESAGADDGTARQQTMQALQQGGLVRSTIFGRDVDLAHFDDFRTRFDASWSWPDMRRLLGMMLFRKFLAHGRPLVENAAVFYLTWPLLEWMRDYSAYAQGKLEPDIEDLRRAFDVVEKGFTLHARGMEGFFAELARTCMLQLEQLPPSGG